MEKVKLTREHAEVLERVRKTHSESEIIKVQADDSDAWASLGALCLNDLSLLELVDALRIGYEVEETFEVGDWVVNVANGRVAQIDHRGIDSLSVWVHDEEFNFFAKDQTRHATPEEIKAEKERRLWKSVGREVGEFREGDVIHDGSNIRFGVDNDITDTEEVRRRYELGTLKGFSPAESFISFGGSDD